MEDLITTFHIDWKLLIAQLINFAVVLSVLYFFAIKPLMKLMKERTSKIEKGLEDAKINVEKLEKTEQEYQQTMSRANKETQEMINQAKKEAQEKRNEMIEKAKNEVGILLIKGKKQLENEKQKIIQEAKGEISNLIVSATKKVLSGTIDTKIDSRLVENSVKELE